MPPVTNTRCGCQKLIREGRDCILRLWTPRFQLVTPPSERKFGFSFAIVFAALVARACGPDAQWRLRY